MVERLICSGGSLRWMPKLPRDLSGAKLRKALLKAGLVEKETSGRGPHRWVLSKPGSAVNISIPDKNPITVGVLRTILSRARLSVDELLALLK